jgi:DMSO/TMAO reductase YedYZ molybdopterin-dependent catalytic subunit
VTTLQNNVVHVSSEILRASVLAKLPAVEVEAVDRGAKHRYTGVLVRDILNRAGVPLENSLRGSTRSLLVRVIGLDNYTVDFALAEFDPAFSDRSVVLAERQDGGPLPENARPFRLIVPGDEHPARWVRRVKSIEVVPIK